MELTELERHLLNELERHALALLRTVKQKPRTGRELKFLKDVESIAQTAECLRLH
ncbi:MAG: hypothetical protein V4662_13760 [Verrucomicrobiota bacterium]